MMNLDSVLQFCRLLMQFQAVERYGTEAPKGFRENDAEHSYSLAMMSWYIISTAKLDLDLQKSIQYSLAHDLVEVYAGDTQPLAQALIKPQKNCEKI